MGKVTGTFSRPNDSLQECPRCGERFDAREDPDGRQHRKASVAHERWYSNELIQNRLREDARFEQRIRVLDEEEARRRGITYEELLAQDAFEQNACWQQDQWRLGRHPEREPLPERTYVPDST